MKNLFLVIFIISILFVSQQGDDMGQTLATLEDSLNVSNINFENKLDEGENKLGYVIVDILYVYLKALIYILFEFTKFIVEYTFGADWIDVELLYVLVLLALLSTLIVPVTKFIIIITIVVKESRAKKRDKKNLEMLRRKKK